MKKNIKMYISVYVFSILANEFCRKFATQIMKHTHTYVHK